MNKNDFGYMPDLSGSDAQIKWANAIGQQHEVLLIDIYSDAAIDSRILNCLYRKESMAEQFKLRIKSNNAKEWLTAKGDLYDTHRADDSAETQGDTAICGET